MHVETGNDASGEHRNRGIWGSKSPPEPAGWNRVSATDQAGPNFPAPCFLNPLSPYRRVLREFIGSLAVNLYPAFATAERISALAIGRDLVACITASFND